MKQALEPRGKVAVPHPVERRRQADAPVSPHSRAIAVSVRELSKAFAKRRRWSEILRSPYRSGEAVVAVDSVSFDVFEGELFGLLGINGAGKTTLLKMLSTVIEPDAGSVSVSGADLGSEGAAVRGLIAPVIADERSLNWRLSATENLRFYGSLSGLRGSGLAGKIREVLGIVGLEDCGTKLVGAFSSGMKQRLLIARGLLSQPRILLLDEPTRSLDPLAARDFRAMLRNQITGNHVEAVILATHNPDEALHLCDRVALLSKGRLIASGHPQQLVRRIGHRVYRLRTRHPIAPQLLNVLGVESLTQLERQDGWAVLEVSLSNDLSASGLLRSLVLDGVEIAAFEKRESTLAELVEALTRQVDSVDG